MKGRDSVTLVERDRDRTKKGGNVRPCLKLVPRDDSNIGISDSEVDWLLAQLDKEERLAQLCKECSIERRTRYFLSARGEMRRRLR